MLVIVVVALFPWLDSAELPGGTKFKFRHKVDELDDSATQLAADDEARQEATGEDQAARDRRVALQEEAERTVADVLAQAAQSPKVGIMVLSAALERELHRLLMGTGWGVARRMWSLRQGIDRLIEVKALPESAARTAALFSQVRNLAVHGRDVDDEDVLRAIDSGLELFNAVANAPRERNFIKAFDIPIFTDPALTDRIDDATAVMLRTVAPTPDKTESERIFPTTRTDFVVGQEVAWLWDYSKSWGPAWYRHPDTHEVLEAWGGSVAFIGPPIDDPLTKTG
ncbi:MAG TPA: hypothetical protein VFY45_27860 [Baekduia sp.]|nr:hypothetical protein [Baekduia sp.]